MLLLLFGYARSSTLYPRQSVCWWPEFRTGVALRLASLFYYGVLFAHKYIHIFLCWNKDVDCIAFVSTEKQMKSSLWNALGVNGRVRFLSPSLKLMWLQEPISSPMVGLPINIWRRKVQTIRTFFFNVQHLNVLTISCILISHILTHDHV